MQIMAGLYIGDMFIAKMNHVVRKKINIMV